METRERGSGVNDERSKPEEKDRSHGGESLISFLGCHKNREMREDILDSECDFSLDPISPKIMKYGPNSMEYSCHKYGDFSFAYRSKKDKAVARIGSHETYEIAIHLFASMDRIHEMLLVSDAWEDGQIPYPWKVTGDPESVKLDDEEMWRYRCYEWKKMVLIARESVTDESKYRGLKEIGLKKESIVLMILCAKCL